VTGLQPLLSLFRVDGESGPEGLGAGGRDAIFTPPEGLGAGGRDAIFTPGDTCMLASWAAYSCFRERGRRRGGGKTVDY